MLMKYEKSLSSYSFLSHFLNEMHRVVSDVVTDDITYIHFARDTYLRFCNATTAAGVILAQFPTYSYEFLLTELSANTRCPFGTILTSTFSSSLPLRRSVGYLLAELR